MIGRKESYTTEQRDLPMKVLENGNIFLSVFELTRLREKIHFLPLHQHSRLRCYIPLSSGHATDMADHY